MKNRILMILTEFPPAIGGMQTHAMNLSRHLHKMGKDVVVYTYRFNNELYSQNEIDETLPFPIKRVFSRISYYFNLQLLIKAVQSIKPNL